MKRDEAFRNFIAACAIGIGWQLLYNDAPNDGDTSSSAAGWRRVIFAEPSLAPLLILVALILLIVSLMTGQRRKLKYEQWQKEQQQQQADGDATDQIKDDENDDLLFLPKISIETDQSSSPSSQHILTIEQMQQIAKQAFPSTISSSYYATKWKKLYCLSRDGDSFGTFLNKVKDEQRTLLVVQTTKGDVFGGYADTSWQTCGASYYGSGQACLFQLKQQHVYNGNNNDNDDNNNDRVSETTSSIPVNTPKDEKSTKTVVKVYKWTGTNRYIQLVNYQREFIAFGGGNAAKATTSPPSSSLDVQSSPSFGLILENDFQRGTTSYCDTFENEPLCSEEDFNILDMECWGFRTDLGVAS